MNMDLLVRVTKGIAIASLAVFVVAVLVKFLPDDGHMGRVKKYQSQMGMPAETQRMNFYRDTVASSESAPAMGMPVPMGKMMNSSDAIAPASSDVEQIEKKVIKTGNVSLKVENAEWSAGEIGKIATEMGGALFSSQFSDNGAGIKSGTVTVKVPVNRFDEAMRRMKSVARVVLNESITGQDVTSEYVDVEARLKNKRSEEEAFTAILAKDAQKVSDILEVTRELSRVRGEIEQLEAQKKYLESQTDMATISAFVSEDPKIGKVDAWRPWQTVKESVNILIQNLQGLVTFLIKLVIVALPILLILFLIFGLFVYWLGKKLYAWLKR
jgi:hypothetical protein